MSVRDWTKQIEHVDIDSIEPHPDNPRQGDRAAIRRSIKANGSYAVLEVQTSTRYIVAGNNTWHVLKELGVDEVAVVWIDDDDAAERILADDNRASDTATYDEERRIALLKKLDERKALTGAITSDEANALFKAFAPRADKGLGSTPNGYLEPDEAEEPESNSAPPRTRIMTLVFERKLGDRIERKLQSIIRDKGVDSFEEALVLLLDADD